MDTRVRDEIATGAKVFVIDVDGNGTYAHGTVAYWGTTEFGAGTWVGVVLDEPLGNTCGGRYFKAARDRGYWAHPSRVVLATDEIHERVAAHERAVQLQPGMRVRTHNQLATVCYVGATDFDEDDDTLWVGVRLDAAIGVDAATHAGNRRDYWYSAGRNDGTVMGTEYFECTPGHALFARPRVVQRVDANGEVLEEDRHHDPVGLQVPRARVVRYRRRAPKGTTRRERQRRRMAELAQRKLSDTERLGDNLDHFRKAELRARSVRDPALRLEVAQKTLRANRLARRRMADIEQERREHEDVENRAARLASELRPTRPVSAPARRSRTIVDDEERVLRQLEWRERRLRGRI